MSNYLHEEGVKALIRKELNDRSVFNLTKNEIKKTKENTMLKIDIKALEAAMTAVKLLSNCQSGEEVMVDFINKTVRFQRVACPIKAGDFINVKGYRVNKGAAEEHYEKKKVIRLEDFYSAVQGMPHGLNGDLLGFVKGGQFCFIDSWRSKIERIDE